MTQITNLHHFSEFCVLEVFFLFLRWHPAFRGNWEEKCKTGMRMGGMKGVSRIGWWKNLWGCFSVSLIHSLI